jgi:hypothetical protein
MPRKSPSVTSDLYRAARASNTLRAAARGPLPFSKRVVRRRVYGVVDRRLGRTLRGLSL